MRKTSTTVCLGPATVRMLSSNGPPMPMPMQVPPGHMVQQIVDEHGILTHVILSPQPPGPGAPLTGGPASGSQYYTSYGSPHYGPPGPGPYPPHHHSVPPHVHGGPHGGMGPPHGGGPHIPSTAAPGCPSHGPGQAQAEYGKFTTVASSAALSSYLSNPTHTSPHHTTAAAAAGTQANELKD
ncbi:fibronectin type iii domain-containing protein 3b [Plakobranchus ocellatus]|uniref:Fibronectin type iii domain-containing protein 3b n=1 Tax=Plakobranchus ocellatus TaxID=259542 RepID=A0AAV4DXH1_9GAST|nr:fibronectin type iii domain-containing protein 3b [Plakobranchus ocellatus]